MSHLRARRHNSPTISCKAWSTQASPTLPSPSSTEALLRGCLQAASPHGLSDAPLGTTQQMERVLKTVECITEAPRPAMQDTLYKSCIHRVSSIVLGSSYTSYNLFITLPSNKSQNPTSLLICGMSTFWHLTPEYFRWHADKQTKMPPCLFSEPEIPATH